MFFWCILYSRKACQGIQKPRNPDTNFFLRYSIDTNTCETFETHLTVHDSFPVTYPNPCLQISQLFPLPASVSTVSRHTSVWNPLFGVAMTIFGEEIYNERMAVTGHQSCLVSISFGFASHCLYCICISIFFHDFDFLMRWNIIVFLYLPDMDKTLKTEQLMNWGVKIFILNLLYYLELKSIFEKRCNFA